MSRGELCSTGGLRPVADLPSEAVYAPEGDVGAGQVGDEDLEAVTVDVGEGELGAGVGFFSAGDGPGPWGPAAEIDEVGDLGHLRALAQIRAIGGDRRDPPLLGDGQTGGA